MATHTVSTIHTAAINHATELCDLADRGDFGDRYWQVRSDLADLICFPVQSCADYVMPSGKRTKMEVRAITAWMVEARG